MMLKVHFCRSNDLGGYLIRLFTRSKWNHVAIEYHDIVWEAMTKDGVRRVSSAGYSESWDACHTVELPVKDPLGAYWFLEDQLGKRYDWMAIFAFPFRTDWADPDKWFCSELVVEALIKSGSDIDEIDLPPERVTPQDLYELVTEK